MTEKYTQLSLWEQPKENTSANYRECSVREGCLRCQHKGFKPKSIVIKDWCKLLDMEISVGHTCDYQEEFRR